MEVGEMGMMESMGMMGSSSASSIVPWFEALEITG
jgi:hypothetical protein